MRLGRSKYVVGTNIIYYRRVAHILWRCHVRGVVECGSRVAVYTIYLILQYLQYIQYIMVLKRSVRYGLLTTFDPKTFRLSKNMNSLYIYSPIVIQQMKNIWLRAIRSGPVTLRTIGTEQYVLQLDSCTSIDIKR